MLKLNIRMAAVPFWWPSIISCISSRTGRGSRHNGHTECADDAEGHLKTACAVICR